MMQVLNLKAETDPRGGRILLSWTNPVFPGFKGTKVLRRESTFPEIPADFGTGLELLNDSTTPAGQSASFTDQNLKSETLYYYAVVACDSAATGFPAYVSALAASPYQTAAQLYRSLPGIYRTYDTVKPPPVPELDPADKDKGQLLRLLEMFGCQFDLLRSYAGGMRDFFSSQRIEGELLPLLAQWIGWPTDFSLPYSKQRNQVDHAPHCYRTTGIAANLRTTINRITTWDAAIKEFAHNIFLARHPEELTIRQMEHTGAAWGPSSLVTLDVAFAGKPSFLLAQDRRPVVFYHALERLPAAREPGRPAAEEQRWQIWYKTLEQDQWLAARRLTSDDNLDMLPAAIRRSDGSLWVFYASHETMSADRRIPGLRLQQVSIGRPALPALMRGGAMAPFALADGDTFAITITTPSAAVARQVTFRQEHFSNIAQAGAAEVARVLELELPGVEAGATEEGSILIESQTAGSGAVLAVPASAGAAKLGIAAGSQAGTDAVAAELTSANAEPFGIADGDSLVITVDGDVPRTVTFSAAQSTAVQIAARINQVAPGVAAPQGGKIVLRSLEPGERSMVAVNTSLSTAASKLGFGAPPPAQVPPLMDDTEPAAFEDAAGNVWLFWSSFRGGAWHIWYSMFNGAAWAGPRQLTAGPQPDREPAAVFDPSGGGTIRVFFSRKKANGLWNIFFSTTKDLNFNSQTWTETELLPLPDTYDNREPAPLLAGPDSVELYFSSNRADGWNTWWKPIGPGPQGPDAALTTGSFTQRAAAPLNIAPGRVRLLFRSNESQVYSSSLYLSAQTIDSRYSGSTTVDTRNPARLGLRGDLRDIQRYTYDTPKQTADAEAKRFYSRDTVGIYLTPDTDDQQLVFRTRDALANLVKRFLPIQVRAVFLVDQTYIEYVYGYSQPGMATAQVIGEQMVDTILSEAIGPASESVTDRVSYRFLRTWDGGIQAGTLPDLAAVPPDLSFRLFQKNVQEGG